MRTRSFPHVIAAGCLLIAATTASAHAPASPPPISAEQAVTYERALGYFRNAQYSAAYGRFMHLADAGHAPSARVALLMHAEGVPLFRSAWSATPAQLQRWQALAAGAPTLPAVEASVE